MKRNVFRTIFTIAFMFLLFDWITDVTFCPVPVYAYANHSQSEAVAWIQARKAEGWAEDYDQDIYTIIPQCVDLIIYYLDYMGVPRMYGHAYQYFGRNDLPAGWYYTSDPSPGDIAVWEAGKGIAGPSGHVALVESVGNGTFNYVDVNGENGKPGHGELSNSDPSSFIHPDFEPLPPTEPEGGDTTEDEDDNKNYGIKKPSIKTTKNKNGYNDVETTWDCIWFGKYPKTNKTFLKQSNGVYYGLMVMMLLYFQI